MRLLAERFGDAAEALRETLDERDPEVAGVFVVALCQSGQREAADGERRFDVSGMDIARGKSLRIVFSRHRSRIQTLTFVSEAIFSYTRVCVNDRLSDAPFCGVHVWLPLRRWHCRQEAFS